MRRAAARRVNAEMKYRGVALGVEAALPAPRAPRRPGRIRRLLLWLVAVLKRWA
jgi:hypothetical protein